MTARNPSMNLRVVARSGPSDARDERLAFGIACGMTREEAAEYAGMSLRSVYHRLNRPEFQALLGQVRTRILREAIGKLTASADDAVVKLRDLMGSDDDSIALRAAQSILDNIIKVGTYADLSQRIADLERRLLK